MRCTRTRYIKSVILFIVVSFVVVQLIGSAGIRLGRKASPSADDSPGSHGGVDDASSQQQHLLKLNALNLLDVTSPTAAAAGGGGSEHSGHKIQNRNDDVSVNANDVADEKPSKGSPEAAADAADKKTAIGSLSGERTHGLSNSSGGTSGGGGKDADSSSSSSASNVNISSILSQMSKLNAEQAVRNEELFGPVTNETLVVVIQVHNRLQYLRHLIVSLSQAKDIEKCLIIFSHDFWDEQINQLISSIDFTKTLQIFYPLSIQTHPNQFPGESPNDCPRNAKKDQAQRLQCLNANWPDLYGHYREAKFTQTKHHWWWKANRVFDQLKVTKNYNGIVLFLEEDHYVAEDFVTSLRLAESVRNEKHPEVAIICIGTYLKTYNYNRDHKTLELTKWVSAKHNMGMAFSRDLWRKIHSCRDLFCNFDDYNWDWSLEHISNNCIQDGLQVLLFKGPRVFHIGECGVHHKKKTCEAGLVVQKVRDILSRAEGFLYPKDLTVTRTVQKKRKQKLPKGNGGWGDERDRQLCLKLAQEDLTTASASTSSAEGQFQNKSLDVGVV